MRAVLLLTVHHRGGGGLWVTKGRRFPATAVSREHVPTELNLHAAPSLLRVQVTGWPTGDLAPASQSTSGIRADWMDVRAPALSGQTIRQSLWVLHRVGFAPREFCTQWVLHRVASAKSARVRQAQRSCLSPCLQASSKRTPRARLLGGGRGSDSTETQLEVDVSRETPRVSCS